MCSIDRFRWILPVLLAVACGDDEPPASDDGADTGTTDDGPGIDCTPGEVQPCTCVGGLMGTQLCTGGELGPCMCDPGGGDDDDDDETGDDDDDDETGDDDDDDDDVLPGCGNGKLEDDEQCDDGNDVDDDECSNMCVTHCGAMWIYEGGVSQTSDIAVDADGVIGFGGSVRRGDGVAPTGVSLDDTGAELGAVTFDVVITGGGVQAHTDGTRAYAFGAFSTMGDKAETGRLHRFDAETGDEAWEIAIDPPVSFDSGFDVRIDPEGDAIVLATIEVADGDTDVWIAKYDDDNGDQLWASTYSGPLNGGFSLEEAGTLSVAEDGSVAASGLIRYTFNELEAELIGVEADGGDPTWAVGLIDDPGSNVTQLPFSVDATDGGTQAMGVNYFVAGLDFRWQAGVYDSGELGVTVTADDIDGKVGGADETAVDPVVELGEESLWVASSWQDPRGGPFNPIIARFDDKGAPICAWRLESGDRDVNDAALLPDGSLVVIGDSETGGWIGRFRP